MGCYEEQVKAGSLDNGWVNSSIEARQDLVSRSWSWRPLVPPPPVTTAVPPEPAELEEVGAWPPTIDPKQGDHHGA